MDRKLKTGIISVIIIVILAFSAYTMYDLNGKSMDFSDSEMKLIVTGSMDADPQPYDIPKIPVNSLVPRPRSSPRRSGPRLSPTNGRAASPAAGRIRSSTSATSA